MKFDQFYSIETSYFSNEHSGGLEKCLKKYSVEPCNAVDIGAGEGRNSVYLASNGFSVSAIEPSCIGAQKIIVKSKEQNLPIDVINSDFLSASKFLSNIRLIVALTSLEHMEVEYLQETVCEIKRILAPGGYFYAIVFTEEDPGYKMDYCNASECAFFVKHYFKKNELRNLFSDLEILEYSEYVKKDTTHGPVHFHGKAKLFARKPL